MSRLVTKIAGNAASLRRLIALLLVALVWHPTPAGAQEGEFPKFSFSGFGTLGIAHSSEDKADFLAHDLQGKGAGAHQSWSMAVDSKIGGQVSAYFTPELSAVVQVIVEQQYDESFRPQVEWANIKYDITPDLSIRAGRIVLSSFLASDYRKVGYSTPWVRPPVELYSLVPLTNSDGVDLSYRLHVGEFTNTFQAGYGVVSERVPDGGKAKTEGGSWHFSNTLERGPATFRAAYSRSRFTVEAFKPLFDLYRNYSTGAAQVSAQLAALGPFAPPGWSEQAAAASVQASQLADKYETEDKDLRFISVGASYDPGDWFVMAEWGQLDIDSVFGKRQAWYVTGGYRWGQFTPYATYSQADLKSKQSDPGITTAPPPLQADAARLNTALNNQLTEAPIQKTISLGLRWDFAKNAALKFQYDYSRIGDGSPGTLDHQQIPGFEPGGSFKVISATLDFVF